MKKIILLLTCAVALSCQTSKKTTVTQELLDDYTFKITEYSKDPTYGYTEKNPILVRGISTQEGPKNERRFLNALSGPNGEEIVFNRLGSCCAFKTKNSPMERNMGLLDKYKITYKGMKDTIVLYLNMYDLGVLQVPVGFTLKK